MIRMALFAAVVANGFRVDVDVVHCSCSCVCFDFQMNDVLCLKDKFVFMCCFQ